MAKQLLTCAFSLLTGGYVLFAGAVMQIAVDQVGYLPHTPKVALIEAVQESSNDKVAKTDQRPAVPRLFQVHDAKSGRTVFEGQLNAPTLSQNSRRMVQTADFTALETHGVYVIHVPGVGQSWQFTIGPEIYRRAYYLAMRSFYGQRCGTAVNLGAEFPGFQHAICHTQGAFHASSGRGAGTPHVSSHGWHDAGDYGRYVVNSAVSTSTLLWAYELYADRIRGVGLHLPESGNGIPDILNEIRWNLDWMVTMQDEDGGVWHKQTSQRFSGFVMPEADSAVSEVIGTGKAPFKSSCATADFAAVMAQAGRVYGPWDARFSERASAASLRAWTWAQANPNVTFDNPAGIATGAYSDAHCDDELLWAAAEIGDEAYFLSHYRAFLPTLRPRDPVSWQDVAPLGLWRYAVAQNGKGEAAADIRKQALDAADSIAARHDANPYRTSLTTADYIWGSNAVAANYSMHLLMAEHLSGDAKYSNAALENLHYLLGRNTFSLSWVTQLGEHAVEHPHHRPSMADKEPLPWPGLLAGGPNPKRQDPAAQQQLPIDVPPARAYIDNDAAYSCNEIAINWNAPLVFVLARFTPAGPQP